MKFAEKWAKLVNIILNNPQKVKLMCFSFMCVSRRETYCFASSLKYNNNSEV